MKYKSIKRAMQEIGIKLSVSVIFRDSVSVSVETQNHGFGRTLIIRYSKVDIVYIIFSFISRLKRMLSFIRLT